MADQQEAKAAKPRRKRGRPRSDGKSKTERQIMRATKINEALNYRRMGYTFAQIGETMGFSTTSARDHVKKGLAGLYYENAVEVRAQMLDRLDYMLQILMKAVVVDEAGDSATINAILAIEERRAKLTGVYQIQDSVDDPESRAGRMLGAAIAQIKADAPVLRPDGPIPLIPIL